MKDSCAQQAPHWVYIILYGLTYLLLAVAVFIAVAFICWIVVAAVGTVADAYHYWRNK